MASCSTTRWVSTAPYVTLTITESSRTDTGVTYKWVLSYYSATPADTTVAKSYTVVINGSTVKTGTYDINGKTGTHTIDSGYTTIVRTASSRSVSFSCSFAFNMSWTDVTTSTQSAIGSLTVPALPSYTIKYNANGGSSTPSSQTKQYDTDITLASAISRPGYSFQGWATSSSGSVAYAANATYSANASITLYAVWKANTYTVKYNANGGSGAPGNQTKTYGVPLTLSTTKPTRTNYTFKGWGTSASATTATYPAGGSYTANSAITLYAVWELAYTKPKISSYQIFRADADGNPDDSGTYLRYVFNWSTFSSSYPITQKRLGYKKSTESTWTYIYPTIADDEVNTGSNSILIGDGVISTDSSYDVSITVTDSGGSTTVTAHVSSMSYVIDFLSGGKGIAIGKAAELENALDIGYDLIVNGRQYGQNKVLWSGKYYMTAGHTITLSEAVSAQPHGIILCWDAYMSGYLGNCDLHYQYIPKYHLVNLTGKGVSTGVMAASDASYIGIKYVYVSDTTITGNADNSVTGTVNGINWARNYWVLRCVIGV